MSTPEDICFGLYLGNSTCSLAVNKKGHIEVPADAAGHRITPAVVALADGGEITTGLPAKQGLLRHGKQSVVGVLRDISCDDPESAPACQTCPPQYSEEGQVSYVLSEDAKRTITASEVLEKIFLEMIDIASHHRSDEFPASLTLPAWLSERAVTLCVEAAHSAGFTLLSVLFQPTAACLAYDLLDRQKDEHILTLHLGESGGSASLVRVAGGVATLKDTTALDTAPGRSVTKKLVEHLAKEFYNKYKGDPLENRRSRQKLTSAAEAAKHLLSRMSEAQVTCECLWEGVDFATKVNRSRFEMMMSSTLAGLVAPLADLVAKAGLEKDAVAKVVLSGGSCNIPKLQALVASAFPAASVLASSPDEVLASGAAREARVLMALQQQHQQQNGAAAAAQQNGVAAAPVEAAGKNKKKNKNKKGKGGANNNNNNTNNNNNNTPAAGAAKKKSRKPVIINTRDHQPTVVATVGVPVWCQVTGGSPHLLLGPLSPPLVRTSLFLALTASPPSTLTVFEAASDPPSDPTPDQVLATVTLPDDPQLSELSVTCQLRADGAIALLLTDPLSKKSKQLLIAADAEDADVTSTTSSS